MSDSVNAASRDRYCLIARGELSADWAGWFDSGSVEGCIARDGYTVLDVSVPDQSALLAVLNRLGALHLPLLLLVRVPT